MLTVDDSGKDAVETVKPNPKLDVLDGPDVPEKN
jgi:hypothetical protein